MTNTPIRRWEKLLVRFSRHGILRQPPNEWPDQEFPDDLWMIFHYCPTYQEYRFDRHYDLLSQTEHFWCGRCGGFYQTRTAVPFRFEMQECARAAREYSRGNVFKEKIFFAYFLATGLEDDLPLDRGGEASGSIVFEAITYLTLSLSR